MAELTFYFDPICPWTWRASQWVREVQSQQPLEVDWKFFSLAHANNFPGDAWFAPLRALALVRRQGGNEAVNQFYLALGEVIHEGGLNIREEGVLAQAIATALDKAQLDPSLLQQAQDDPSTLEQVLADHTEAVEKYKAYGSPWLVVGDQPFGFNGPIITEVPQGKTAQELWEHTSWMITQPYFYEVKRNRG